MISTTHADTLTLIGRILLAAIFVLSGINKITGFAGTAEEMSAHGLPYSEPLLVLTIVVELGAGLLLVLGWLTRWAAWALIVFVVIVTAVYHPFWTFPEDQVRLQMIMFMKNLAMIGGLLYVAAAGPGGFSIDRR